MKIIIRILMCMMTIACMQTTHADDSAANIKIHIAGAQSDNRYFLCLPDTGCLSIRAGDQGKTYPIFHAIDMSSIYVTDVSNNFQVTGENPTASCNVTVQPSQTVTVSGYISVGADKKVKINRLHCTVT